jgi:hypothetical protein
VGAAISFELLPRWWWLGRRFLVRYFGRTFPANAAINSAKYFRVASWLRPRFSSSGLLAAGKLLALTQEAYGAVVAFRRAN